MQENEPRHLLLAGHQIVGPQVGRTSHHPEVVENNITNSKKARGQQKQI